MNEGPILELTTMMDEMVRRRSSSSGVTARSPRWTKV